MMNSVRLAISLGDFNGIGPEVVLKTLADKRPDSVTPLLLGSETVFRYYAAQIQPSPSWHVCSSPSEVKEGEINLLESSTVEKEEIEPGEISSAAGRAAMKAVEDGIRLCLSGQADGLVTAPISKEAVNRAGYDIPGHTEFLAEKTSTDRVMMILVDGPFRVGLATGHLPVSEVAGRITEPLLSEHLDLMNASLKDDFGIGNPAIAVLGLNPHAGDGGVIGREESETILPAVKEAVRRGLNVTGPHSADGFFGQQRQEKYDGVLAMYHDQGLIPFKTLSFGKGVNFTAGLPIVRTSPDHGTAFDIAGDNRADPASFSRAFALAAELARNRKISSHG